jgi:isoquinoline 1-oxidoreductase alpha subunit
MPHLTLEMPMRDNAPVAPKTPAAPAAAPVLPVVDDKSLPLRINGKPYSFEGDVDMPLLWYLRDTLRLTGTKFGCGTGACGACTVLIDGKAQRSCLTTMKNTARHEVTTIEGLAGAELHPLQQAWIEVDVAQCGYCQAGQILAAADLLRRIPNPNDDEIGKISNLCRCGTYPRIRRAIKRAVEIAKETSGK